MGCGLRHVPPTNSLVPKFRVLPAGLDWPGSADSCHCFTTGSCSSLHSRLGRGIDVFLRLLLLAHLLHDSLWRPSIRCSVSAAYSDYAYRWSFPGSVRDDVGPRYKEMGSRCRAPRTMFLDCARMVSTGNNRSAVECNRLLPGWRF